MSGYRVPLVFRILIGAGLILWLNQAVPGSVQMIFALLALYLVATHASRAGELVGSLPSGLGSFLSPTPSAGPRPSTAL